MSNVGNAPGTGGNREIEIVDDSPELNRAAADEFSRLARTAVSRNGRFAVALAGGSTPRSVYSLLASDDQANPADRLPWEQIHIFFGDERHVSPDHADSNYRMASESLLSKVAIPQANVHRVRAELESAAEAADLYEIDIKDFFRKENAGNADAVPKFDLIMLGMGPDGHTASLFPGSEGLNETARLVVANWVEKFNTFRITFTYKLLNNAAQIMFLVTGKDKGEMLHNVLEGDPSGKTYPSQGIKPTTGRLLWLVDRAAATLLRNR